MNRINLIGLGVKDMEKSLAFYKNIGFKTYVKEDIPILFFDNKGSKLELYPIEMLAKKISAENPPMINKEGFCGITLACSMKSEKEVDDLFAIIEKCGGTIAKNPKKYSGEDIADIFKPLWLYPVAVFPCFNGWGEIASEVGCFRIED